jgi:hypothetical protein
MAYPKDKIGSFIYGNALTYPLDNPFLKVKT